MDTRCYRRHFFYHCKSNTWPLLGQTSYLKMSPSALSNHDGYFSLFFDIVLIKQLIDWSKNNQQIFNRVIPTVISFSPSLMENMFSFLKHYFIIFSILHTLFPTEQYICHLSFWSTSISSPHCGSVCIRQMLDTPKTLSRIVFFKHNLLCSPMIWL